MRAATLRPWSEPGQAVLLLVCGATLRTCLPVAVVVGTVLSLVNQLDVALRTGLDAGLVLKLLANDAIPFLTSSTGALLVLRERAGREAAG